MASNSWTPFIQWAVRFYEEPKFEANETTYKIAIADHLREARSALEENSPKWIESLKRAVLGSPNNLTHYILNGKFLNWVAANPTDARSALLAIWSRNENGGIKAFLDRLPKTAVSGKGSRLSLASLLQLAVDEYRLPFYKPTPVELGYELANYDPPAKDADEAATYQHFLTFLDAFIAEAQTRGLDIPDRLSAQGLLWTVTSWKPPSTWSVDEQEALLRFRGEKGPVDSVPALHLLFKWTVTPSWDTIERHKEIADRDGSVWWGAFGTPGNPGVSEAKREKLAQQMAQGIPTYAFLYNPRSLWRTRLEGLATDPSEIDEAKYPEFGRDLPCKLFALVSEFEPLDVGWATENLASARTGAPLEAGGALGNQTSPLQVVITKRPPPPPGMGDRRAEFLKRTNLDGVDLDELVLLLQTKQQIILEGPPGSGKTYIAELLARYLSGNPLTGTYSETFEIVQFHQSYGYEDFVQGIRPLTRDDGSLEYRVVDGIFRRFAETAAKNPDKTFVMLIDEINRGNVSRVFGELLLLLEYRDKQVALPYALPADPPFSIPKNLLLIGTMNTADRSLAQIDYALRRRFYFYRLTPVVNGKAPILERWLGKEVSSAESQAVLRLFVRLNEKLEGLLGQHFQVGHSYFMDPEIGHPARQRLVWRHAIEPLLEEYFYSRRDLQTVLTEFDLDQLLQEPDETAAPETHDE